MIGLKQWNICVVPGNLKGVPSWNYIEETMRDFVPKDLLEII